MREFLRLTWHFLMLNFWLIGPGLALIIYMLIQKIKAVVS